MMVARVTMICLLRVLTIKFRLLQTSGWLYSSPPLPLTSVLQASLVTSLTDAPTPRALMKVADNSTRTQKLAKKKPGRVPVSCAECRRLKMKCDRGNPCENCTKRGCAVICPDGTLTTGRHNRMILSNTEELHDKIEALCERIRILEDALRTLQASVSTEPHPLLTAPTMESIPPAIHVYPTRNDVTFAQGSTAVGDDEALDSFGTLSIGSDGETSYLGHTARADYLVNESDSDDEREVGRLPRSFYNFCWPECPPPDNSIEEVVLSFLPDLNEAYALSDTYCRMSSWLGFLIPREMIREDFIANVYHLPNRPWADTPLTCPHRLSLLFGIFSIGALFDSNQGPNNVQADDYYHLARVALSFKSAVLETTIYAVSAIVHMAYILLLRDSYASHEQGWVMLGVANKMAFGMGLHRDSSLWSLHEDICERRHTTFWQLYLIETIASFRFGRPASISDTFIDCPIPKFLDEKQAQSTSYAAKYLSWLVQFGKLAQQTLSEVLGSKSLSYSAVLQADLRIRALTELDQHESLGDDREDAIAKGFHWCVSHCVESVLLHIHRPFLLRALDENPQNPLASKYGKSVQACFESSYRLIESTAWITEQHPQISSRMSYLSGIAVSAAIVMCIVATRCPTSQLSRPAMEKIDSIHATLQKITMMNLTAQRNLVITRRLRNLARAAFERSRLSLNGAVIPPDDSDILSRGCGRTHIRTRKERTRDTTKRQRQFNSRSSIVIDQPSREEPSERGDKVRQTSNSSGTSSYGDDFSRIGLLGDSYNSLLGPALDSTWNTFIQQLGF